MHINKKIRRGYTLFEILIAIAIITILTTVLVSKTPTIRNKEVLQTKNNNSVFQTLASESEKLNVDSKLSLSDLANAVFNELKEDESVKNLINPYDKSATGIGIDLSTTPNLKTGNAAYILVKEPNSYSVPKGTVYYVVSKKVASSDPLITGIPETVVADDITINDGLLGEPVIDPTPPEGETSIPKMVNGVYQIWYYDQLPNIPKASGIKIKLMRSLDADVGPHFLSWESDSIYRVKYPKFNIYPDSIFDGNNKTIKTYFYFPIFDVIKGTVKNLTILNTNQSTHHILAFELSGATLDNVKLDGVFKSPNENLYSDTETYYVAPVARKCSYSTLTNVHVTADITTPDNVRGISYIYASGFVNTDLNKGESKGTSFTNCSFTGSVLLTDWSGTTGTDYYTSRSYIGEAAGFVNESSSGTVQSTMTNCSINADIGGNRSSLISNNIGSYKLTSFSSSGTVESNR